MLQVYFKANIYYKMYIQKFSELANNQVNGAELGENNILLNVRSNPKIVRRVTPAFIKC